MTVPVMKTVCQPVGTVSEHHGGAPGPDRGVYAVPCTMLGGRRPEGGSSQGGPVPLRRT